MTEFGSVIRALFIHFQHRVLHKYTLAYRLTVLWVESFIAWISEVSLGLCFQRFLMQIKTLYFVRGLFHVGYNFEEGRDVEGNLSRISIFLIYYFNGVEYKQSIYHISFQCMQFSAIKCLHDVQLLAPSISRPHSTRNLCPFNSNCLFFPPQHPDKHRSLLLSLCFWWLHPILRGTVKYLSEWCHLV